MSIQIIFKPEAIKSLEKLPVSEKRKINKKIEALKKNPFLGKKLNGHLVGIYSLRAWPYRILYRFSNSNNISIETVAHRQSVYN